MNVYRCQCSAPGCEKVIEKRFDFCRECWMRLPDQLRRDITRHQHRRDKGAAYAAVVRAQTFLIGATTS